MIDSITLFLSSIVVLAVVFYSGFYLGQLSENLKYSKQIQALTDEVNQEIKSILQEMKK